MSVISKFKGKLPKDDLKRFGKEVSLAQILLPRSPPDYLLCRLARNSSASDFKNNRVEDPTQISSKQEKGYQEVRKRIL